MSSNVPPGDQPTREASLHVSACGRTIAHAPVRPARRHPPRGMGQCQRRSRCPGAQNWAWVRKSVDGSAEGRRRSLGGEQRAQVGHAVNAPPSAHCSEPPPDRTRVGGHPGPWGRSVLLLGTVCCSLLEGEDGRVLKISAGVRYVQLPAYSEVSFFKVDEDSQELPIQTPFGFECISYPLSSPTSGGPELSATPESASTDSPLPKGDLEVTMVSNALCDQEDTPGSLSAGGGMTRCPEDCRRVERGQAQFTDVWLGPPPPGYHPIPFLDSKHEKASSRPRGSLGPGRMTPTVRDPPAGSRPDGAAKAEPVTAAFPGEYVIIIRDVTNPPFLGRVLPTAFKHLRVSLKGMGQQPHIPGEGPQASN